MSDVPKARCGCPADTPRWAEPLTFVAPPTPGRTTFASIALCVGCRKPVGDVRLEFVPKGDQEEDAGAKAARARLRAVQKAFNGTSWAMMLDPKDGHPWPPYVFKLGCTGCLIPESYHGELKMQPALPEADPREDFA